MFEFLMDNSVPSSSNGERMPKKPVYIKREPVYHDEEDPSESYGYDHGNRYVPATDHFAAVEQATRSSLPVVRPSRKRRDDDFVDLNDDEELGRLISREYVRQRLSSEEELTEFVKKLPLKTPRLQPLVQDVLDPYLDRETKSTLLRFLGETAREVHHSGDNSDVISPQQPQRKFPVTVKQEFLPSSTSYTEEFRTFENNTDPLRNCNPFDFDPTATFGLYFTSPSEHFIGGLDIGRRFAAIRTSYARGKNVRYMRIAVRGITAVQMWSDLGILIVLDALANKREFDRTSLISKRKQSDEFPIIALCEGADKKTTDAIIDFFVALVGRSCDEELVLQIAFRKCIANGLLNARRNLCTKRATRSKNEHHRTLDYYLRLLPADSLTRDVQAEQVVYEEVIVEHEEEVTDSQQPFVDKRSSRQSAFKR